MDGLPIAFVASLLLGMRHATDADHIIAVTTIVNRERMAWRSSQIGVMWGLGHSLTILVAGGAIVLFKLAFTPRLGLSMEFSVAMMLMVLGYLNLIKRGPIPEGVPQLRPFLVGAVHGMAGSAAATLLILPSLTTRGGQRSISVVLAWVRWPAARHSRCVRRREPRLRRVPRLQGWIRRRAIHRAAALNAVVAAYLNPS